MEFDISKNRIGFFSKIKFFEKIEDKDIINLKKNEIKSQNSSACKYFSLKIYKTFWLFMTILLVIHVRAAISSYCSIAKMASIIRCSNQPSLKLLVLSLMPL